MEELVTEISFELRTTQTNEDKTAFRNGTAKYICRAIGSTVLKKRRCEPLLLSIT